MRILALDYSTHAGYAIFDDGKLVEHGTIHCDLDLKTSEYPWNYLGVARRQAFLIAERFTADGFPDAIVIEETNGSKNRYTQKLLEFLHFALLELLLERNRHLRGSGYFPLPNIVYVNTIDWRSNLGIWLTKEQKKANAKLSRAKRQAAESGKKLDKKALGIKGKVTKKHAAINYVNERFGFNLKVKDNDAAEAICIGLAYLNNVPHCNGE